MSIVNPLSALVIDRKALPADARASVSRASAPLIRAAAASARWRGDELVAIDTCERLDMYAGSAVVFEFEDAAGRDAAEALGHATRLEGERVAVRAFRLCAGMDSRLPGEAEVLGQVRAALREAESANLASGTVGELFTRAIRCGRKVRAETGFGRVEVFFKWYNWAGFLAVKSDCLAAGPGVGSVSVRSTPSGAEPRPPGAGLGGR